MFEKVLPYDLPILYKLNVAWSRPESDRFWLAVTHLHKLPWVIYGVLPALLLWGVYIYRWHIVKPILFVALAVGLADSLCYRGIKSVVDRPRPFQNENIDWLRQVGEAHGPSFPSNHAANCFAAASILAFYWRRQWYLFYTLAILVALSRPALGVHYPSDVVAGALVGLVVASLIKGFVLKRSPRFLLPVSVSEEDEKSVDWRVRTGREF